MLHVCVFIYTVMAKNIGTFGKYDQRIISSLSLLISHFGYFPPNACSVHSSASASMQGWVFYMYLRFDLNENSSSLRWVQYRLYPKWRYADEKRQRGVIFIFFVYKKYSRRFTKIQIEQGSVKAGLGLFLYCMALHWPQVLKLCVLFVALCVCVCVCACVRACVCVF